MSKLGQHYFYGVANFKATIKGDIKDVVPERKILVEDIDTKKMTWLNECHLPFQIRKTLLEWVHRNTGRIMKIVVLGTLEV